VKSSGRKGALPVAAQDRALTLQALGEEEVRLAWQAQCRGVELDLLKVGHDPVFPARWDPSPLSREKVGV
jgi:hypothetical protein